MAKSKALRRQYGFTLLELMFVLGIVTLMAVTEMQSKAAQLEQARARQLGIQLYQYNNAVRSYLAEHPGTTATHSGTNWLKDNSCGGTANKSYLPCSYPDQLSLGGLTLLTVLSTSSGASIARTTLPELKLAGKLRPDLAGLAALTASGGSVNALLPTLATTDASFSSDPNSAIITFEASTRADNDVWLRTDGGNSMHANLNFDSADSAMRNITSVNRITSLANSVLTLGQSGINSHVLIDANAEVVGTLTARSNLIVQGSASVAGTATIGGNFTANQNANVGVDLGVNRNVSIGQDIGVGRNATVAGSAAVYGHLNVGLGANVGGDLAARNIHSNNGITASNNIHAGQNLFANQAVVSSNVQSHIYYDRDDYQYYADPAGVSSMNVIDANYIRDKNDTSYMVDPSHTSRLNYADLNYARLRSSFVEGGGCTDKEIGTNGSGELMSCVNGRWKKPGDADGGAFWFAQRTFTNDRCYLGQCQPNPKTGDYTCPPGYIAVGGLVGQAYRFDEWDQSSYYYTCVSN